MSKMIWRKSAASVGSTHAPAFTTTRPSWSRGLRIGMLSSGCFPHFILAARSVLHSVECHSDTFPAVTRQDHVVLGLESLVVAAVAHFARAFRGPQDRGHRIIEQGAEMRLLSLQRKPRP